LTSIKDMFGTIDGTDVFKVILSKCDAQDATAKGAEWEKRKSQRQTELKLAVLLAAGS